MGHPDGDRFPRRGHHPPTDSAAPDPGADEPQFPDQLVEAAILDLLAQRDPGKTICPSEAARALAGSRDFRPLMSEVRAVATAMVARGELEVTQSGQVVDPSSARGAIRLRLPDA